MAMFKNVFLFGAFFLMSSRAAPTENGVAPLKVPAACKDQVFCSERPEGYDLLEDEINSVLPDFLVKDFAERLGEETPSEGPQLSPKDDWHNCPYVTRRQSMFLYNRGGNDTKFDIFVQTKLFKQYVDVVTCATEHISTVNNEQCFKGLGVSAFHMKSSCENTMAKRTLYVYDIERKKVIQKFFEVPACCTCKVSY